MFGQYTDIIPYPPLLAVALLQTPPKLHAYSSSVSAPSSAHTNGIYSEHSAKAVII